MSGLHDGALGLTTDVSLVDGFVTGGVTGGNHPATPCCWRNAPVMQTHFFCWSPVTTTSGRVGIPADAFWVNSSGAGRLRGDWPASAHQARTPVCMQPSTSWSAIHGQHGDHPAGGRHGEVVAGWVPHHPGERFRCLPHRY